MALDGSSSDLWSNLGPELLELVANRLCCAGVIRLSFVCRSWRSVITTCSSYKLSPKTHLWMILPDHSGSLSLKNVYNHRIYEAETPQLFRHRICGSCLDGWLVTMDKKGNIQVFHPFTKMLIDLPDVSRVPGMLVSLTEDGTVYNYTYTADCLVECCQYNATAMRDFFIYKVVLSSDRLIAVALYGCMRKLGFCRIGEETWIDIDIESEDVIFYKGVFYAVNDSGAVFAVSGLLTDSPIVSLVICSPPYPHNKMYCVNNHLVESLQGELMLITRIRQGGKGGYETVRFRVAKRDVKRDYLWMHVEDFGNDSSVFVGVNHSFCVRNSDLPEYYDRNRNYIFFTDYEDSFRKNDGDDFGDFDLQSGTIKRWDWKRKLLKLPPPVWFTTIRM